MYFRGGFCALCLSWGVMGIPVADAVERPHPSVEVEIGEATEMVTDPLTAKGPVGFSQRGDIAIDVTSNVLPDQQPGEDARSALPFAAVCSGVLAGGYGLFKYNVAKDAYSRYLMTPDDQEALSIWDEEVTPNQRQAIIAGSASVALIGVAIAMTARSRATVAISAQNNGVFVSGTW